MAGLLITSQNSRPGVRRGILSGSLVAGRAFAVAVKVNTILWGNQQLPRRRPAGGGPWPGGKWECRIAAGFTGGLSYRNRTVDCGRSTAHTMGVRGDTT